MDDEFPYMFNGLLESMYDDSSYVGLAVPADYEAALPFGKGGRLRVRGEMNGVPVEGALVPLNQKKYIMVSKRLRKMIGTELGEMINFRFAVVAANTVRVPPELEEVFELDTDAAQRWEQWPVGKRRSLFYKFEKAKTAATKQKYVEQVLEELLG